MKTDNQLYTEIVEKLEFEPSINPKYITMSVHEGIVTLAGSVERYAEKRMVERAVRTIQGVKGIANDLEVNLETGLKRTDTDIAQSAINALKWAFNIPTDKIKVTVENGQLKLTGEVDWWYQRQNSEKAVRYLVGVRGIDNQIKVKPAIPMISPMEVKEKITKEFARNALIDARNIQVETVDSQILLKGHVRSWAEYKEANRAAWSIPGVSKVSNQLMVTYDSL